MNKAQRISGIVFAILILLISLAVIGESALAGIVGLCAAAGLFIYCLSGRTVGTEIEKIKLNSIFNFKNKYFKFTIIFLVILISLVVIGSIISVSQEKEKKRVELIFPRKSGHKEELVVA